MMRKADFIIAPVPTYDLYGEGRRKRHDFWIHCETIASRSSAYRWEIRPHRHDSFFQLLYIRNGSGDATIALESVTLSPPCIVMMPPGVSHGYRFSRDVEGHVVTFVTDHLRMTAGLSKRPGDWLAMPRVVVLDGDDGAFLDASVGRIAEEFEARRTGRNDLIEAYLTSALLLLARMAVPGSEGDGGGGRSRVDMLRELIGRHFREQLSAAAYARYLNLSPTHLNRIVRDETGMTVHDLIMARVIDEARRALVFTPASVQQVADTLGFSDAAYFSRWFRKRTGQTPGDYRRGERLKLAEA